jgi:hypothetical protein
MPLPFSVSFIGMLSSPLELRGKSEDLILTFTAVVHTLIKLKVTCFKGHFKVHLRYFTFNFAVTA